MWHKRTLAGRVMAYSLIVNSVLLIALGSVLTMLSGSVLQDEVAGYTQKMLVQANRLLDNCLIDVRSRLVRLASMQGVVSCMSQREVSFARTLAYEREIDEKLANVDLFNPVKDVLILGNNGYVYNLYKRQNLVSGYDYAACPWYRQAVTVEDGVYIQMLPLHSQTYYTKKAEPVAYSEPTISLSMAVTNASYETVGAVVCNLDLRKLGQTLMEGNYERSGRIALLDPAGVICAQNDGERTGDVLALSSADAQRLSVEGSGHFVAQMAGERYLVCHDTSDFSGWKLVSYVLLREIKAHAAPLRMILFPALLACLALNTAVAYLYARSVQRPVGALIEALAQVDAANPAPIAVRPEYVELQRISARFNDLLEHINLLIRKDYRTQLELSRFELAALQSQINPHFLFNTLQLLQTEILYGNVEESNTLIISLSQLLRYYMASGESTVTVAQEMEYLEKYLLLFTRKYEGRLTTDIDVQPETKSLRMPKLLLQPVVENAIRHAVDVRAQTCTVSVCVRLRGADLIVSIEDDGDGIDEARLAQIRAGLEQRVDWMKSGVGLANVHQRISALYGEGYGLSIDSGPDGTTVVVRLPGREDENESKKGGAT